MKSFRKGFKKVKVFGEDGFQDFADPLEEFQGWFYFIDFVLLISIMWFPSRNFIIPFLIDFELSIHFFIQDHSLIKNSLAILEGT